jgi:hypothetical protein
VDAERKRGRVHRGDRDSPLEQELEHRCDHAAVPAHDRRAFVLGLAVVIEGDHLDVVAAMERGEFAEAVGARDLDEHKALHGVTVDRRGLDARDLVRVQVVELAHVPVHAAVQADARARIQQLRGEHPSERVEIDVRVREDQRMDRDLGSHRASRSILRACGLAALGGSGPQVAAARRGFAPRVESGEQR